MSSTTEIKSLHRSPESFVGTSVTINGWVRTLRSKKSFGFIEINDGSFFKGIQVVFEDNLDNFEEIGSFGVGSALSITGEVVESPGSGQSIEIKATSVTLVGASSSDYKLQKKRHSFEFLRTIAHFRPRTNTFSAVFRIRSLVAHAIHTFFQERNFVYLHSPIITASDAEGAGEMFRVTTLDLMNTPTAEHGVDFSQDFFGRETSLTVSGQLSAEAYALAFNKVYTFGPTFRAENSNTSRHASEFWMIEPEIAFADLQDDIKLTDDMMKFIVSYVLEKAPEEMEFFNKFIDKTLLERLTTFVNTPSEHLTYTKAVEILQGSSKKFEYPVEWGQDLQTEHERFLAEEYVKGPVFITDYPKDIKAFYMRLNDDQKTVAAMDMLVPGVGEIVGGSQREERYDVLLERMQALGLSAEDYWWYLELRKYGGTPHAGFGLGFERAVMYVTGMENIRDVIPFPRTPKSADF